MNSESIQTVFPWLAVAAICLPLFSAFVNLFIRENYAWLSPLISSFLLLIATLSTVILFFQSFNNYIIEYSWNWFTINSKTIDANILIDGNALIMMLVVSIVSLLVHLFSMGYMAEDQAPSRYFGMLGFFTFAMLGLVVSGNLLFTFFFWELVGFSSYRLIGHWYSKPAAALAATKAFLLNRVGDLGFLIGLMILWSAYGHLNYAQFALDSPPIEYWSIAWIFIFLAVIGKSAQFPLFHWLPDAMEGPTPVSALIHAATMVAAGVYLLVRVSFLLPADVMALISIFGIITALIGAWGALVQYDIKKILAYSTISQLGFMVMAIGSASGGFLHLLHHAFFKAGLFLGAGAVIHAMHQAFHHHGSGIDVQDIRNLGGLRKKMPVTFFTFLICASALAGLPFTSGFVSKELILTGMNHWAGDVINWKWAVVGGAWILSFLTPMYTFRLVWFIFFTKPKHTIKPEEVPVIMQIPLILLAFLSISIIFYNFSGHTFSVINLLLNYYPDSNNLITIVSIFIITLSLFVSFTIYKKKNLHNLSGLCTPQYYLDFITDKVVSLTTKISRISNWIDKKIIDPLIHANAYLGVTLAHLISWTDKTLVDGVVNGTARSTQVLGAVSRMMVNGKIQSYLIWAMAALLIFILWILF